MKVHSLVVCLFVVLSAGFLYGQGGANGTILGTVTDNTGAVMAKVSVDVTNVATGVVAHAETSSSGDFTVPYLTPGTYAIAAQAPGFQKSIVDNISLVVGQQARVNLTLKPGAVTESVEVQASAVALDTDSSAVSQLVSAKQVEQLPLNGRNFLQLLFIGAGAVQTNGEQGQMRQGEGNAISINGGRPESNNYTLDGLANTDTALNTPAVILSQDAIQEFKVMSETYSAEYGFSANQINIVSKSGTNQIHGTAFDFFRNDALDARAPFQGTIPELRQNQFGFVVGGPVYIPKLYDGRNKTFFLVNYEGWRIKNGVAGFTNVPSTDQVNGDFSGSGLPAYDLTAGSPCRVALASNNPCMPGDPATGLPFAGNIIPAGRFSRLAGVELGAGLFGGPNCFTSDCLGNFRINTALPLTTNQQTYKLDQHLGRLGSVFFRWTNATYTNQTGGSPSGVFGNAIFEEKSQSWEISHTIPLGRSMVNNFRFGKLEPVANQGGFPAPDSDVAAMGITGVFSPTDFYRLYPTLSPSGFASFGSQGNDASTSDVPMWQFGDSLTMVRGKHTIGIGFEYRNWIQKRNLSADFLGNFGYRSDTVLQNGSSTGVNAEPVNGCTTPTCGTGNSVADMLLGYYNNASTFQPGPFSPAGVAGNLNQYHFMYFAPYVQDDWKVTPRLTLNLGLRWDYRAVPYEQDNKMFWFDVANPGGGLCFADKGLGTESVAGLGGPIAPDGNGFYRYCGRRNPADGSKRPFAPRFGFAYRPWDKTVIRGGYGVFWDSSLTREIDDSGDIYPFVVRASANPTTDSTVPKLTDNMFTPVPLHQASVATDGSQFFAVIISERPRNPSVQQWTLSVQRELARNTTLEVNYVGNKGTHLLNRTNIGAPLPPANPALCQADPTQGDCPNANRRPYANITSFGFLDSRWDGYSNYNAGNIKLEHRSNSMALTAVYTWAKSLDDKSAPAGIGAVNAFAGHLDDRHPRLDYGPSDFNVDHRFVASYVYQLPIGRGKRFGGGMNKIADLAVGGWQVTGITTFQTGFPFSVLANDTFGLLDAFNQRANLVSGCDPNSGFHKSLNQWFNTSCFTQPIAGTYGNSGRNILRQPGLNNWDLGIGKSFAFTERIGFQLRLETFNTFNHSQYAIDTGTTLLGVASVDNNVNDVAPAANTNYGRVTYARPGRIVQLGGKITF
jgi:Carboxypeptidase regulatory-like domain/TonB dependent receptor-like, beta-barrel